VTDGGGVARPLTAGGDRPSGPFGSALTVRDFALLEEGKLEPLAPVMGCELRWLSVWLPLPAARPLRQPGSAQRVYGQRWENDVIAVPELDDLVSTTRQRVLGQIKEQAAAVGGDAVVGVRRVPGPIPSHEVTTEVRKRVRSSVPNQSPLFNHALDYQLIGTAVREPASRSEEPALSTLSVAEFAKLRRGGWQPAGVVSGCSHYFGGNVRAGIVAREVEADTETWASARTTAFEQLRAGITELSADGVIGLDVESEHWSFRLPARGRRSQPAAGVLVRVSAIATAIRRADEPPPDAATPIRILTLR
jgi:uncharacterized protein YbjQ (UPF0145 family)